MEKSPRISKSVVGIYRYQKTYMCCIFARVCVRILCHVHLYFVLCVYTWVTLICLSVCFISVVLFG